MPMFVINQNNSLEATISITVIRIMIIESGDTIWCITASSDVTLYLTATREP